MQILFPTLIVCCFKNDDNMLILTQEVSTALLESYIEETIVKSQIEQIESKSSPLQKSIGTLHPNRHTRSLILTNVPDYTHYTCSYWEVVIAVALLEKSLEWGQVLL